MIENMRGRTAETKYGRIPLWLYEAGVSLQAIATYGWLHGRYGHYDRMMPSYGTLAKELGVSRGSVITYVKALMAAGALRIEESGAADHRTNTYAIAFNEPFPVEAQVGAGQPADQSGELVSRLTRTGQRADLAGQPVEHEEDVFKKTYKTSPSRPPAQRRAAPVARPAQTEEEAGSSLELNRAILFLQRLPGPWTVGPKDAQRIAPALLGTAGRLGWSLDDDLAAQLCTNPDGINSYAAVLERDRIPNLIPHQAVHGQRSNLKPACGTCLDNNPHAAHNPRWRTRSGQPCPACHPNVHASAA
ncbi:hypothetical protein AB0D10_05335 [Kitasatospora sp. NPDC048545]|uniref:hypothetical protein n=1 Tax=Kitasatospora sp. NPDC048545 TaxID=3157208 RepID=UPI0033CC8E03